MAEYDPAVSIILPALAFVFAAFCVWLAVRIVNRRERWAKWTLTVTLSLPVLYVLSFGPATWLATCAWSPQWISHAYVYLYLPLHQIRFDYDDLDALNPIGEVLNWYANMCHGDEPLIDL